MTVFAIDRWPMNACKVRYQRRGPLVRSPPSGAHVHVDRERQPGGHTKPLDERAVLLVHVADSQTGKPTPRAALEDPLGRMLLLLRSRLVVIENAVDHWNKWIFAGGFLRK